MLCAQFDIFIRYCVGLLNWSRVNKDVPDNLYIFKNNSKISQDCRAFVLFAYETSKRSVFLMGHLTGRT